jgi:site-specific DNA-methyltransferase (adenine-specific)
MSYIKILQGDCREQLRNIADASIDSIVTDPPYELGFMNRKWDSTGIAYDITVWQECLRVLKPGGHLLSFGGTRTYHRMTCAIEDAGFEIRDCIMWVYGSGFPKSHDVSKAIDKAAGAEREVVGIRVDADGRSRGSEPHSAMIYGRETCYGKDNRSVEEIKTITAPATEAARQWQGWGSALKPAVEPIVCARKPLEGTIVENVLVHGTGAINVDGCRVGTESTFRTNGKTAIWADGGMNSEQGGSASGRWPANLIHDGSQEVVDLFPETSSGSGAKNTRRSAGNIFGSVKPNDVFTQGDSGSAARFFYCAKTSPSERGDNRHPTVKPLALMRYLCRLVTPPQGVVLDPFAGSGSTLVAARAEGFSAIGCELEAAHIDIIKRRLDLPIESAEEQPREEKQQDSKKASTQLKLF